MADGRSVFHKLLGSPHASLITHTSLVAVTGLIFGLLLCSPLWVAAIPCALLHYRVGALLHEYIHGIPFRRYKQCLWILSMFEGVLITFGLLEVFRGIHLAHHRWLNTAKDPGFEAEREHLPSTTVERLRWYMGQILRGNSGPMLYINALFGAFQGRHPYIKSKRIMIGIVLSILSAVFWIVVGRPSLPLMLVMLNLYSALVPSSFRGAVEHSSYKGDPNFANEYRVWIPLFNLNRHIHHHLDSTCPWYLLKFCTANPLPPFCYWTHWIRMFIKQDYVLMQPMAAPPKQRRTGTTGGA
jgi:fatty acid desaturase